MGAIACWTAAVIALVQGVDNQYLTIKPPRQEKTHFQSGRRPALNAALGYYASGCLNHRRYDRYHRGGGGHTFFATATSALPHSPRPFPDVTNMDHRSCFGLAVPHRLKKKSSYPFRNTSTAGHRPSPQISRTALCLSRSATRHSATGRKERL